MSRNTRIPLQARARNTQRVPKDKHTVSDCYSITIRTGKGVSLGSNSFSKVLEYLKGISQYYVLALEMEDDKRHLQGGIFTHIPMRQDKIREKLLPLVVSMWEEEMSNQEQVCTLLARQQVIKNALCVKAHNNWEILVKYCLKDPTYYIGHQSPVNLLNIGFSCKHEDNKKNCKYYWFFGKCIDDIQKNLYLSM